MNIESDAEDDFDFMPTELDLARIRDMLCGEVVNAEDQSWQVMKWSHTYDLIIRQYNEDDTILTFNNLEDLLKYFEL